MAQLRAAVIMYTDGQLLAQLLGLALTGYVDLRQRALAGKVTPDLYKSGVRYLREPPGSEVWQVPTAMLASKVADCEDLAAGFRVPQLWTYGETAAAPYVLRISARLRHIVVERADGSIEDPSACLGMHKKSNPREAAELLAKVRAPMPTPGVALPFGLSRPTSPLFPRSDALRGIQ